MRLLASFLLLTLALPGATRTYNITAGLEPDGWRELLGAFGLELSTGAADLQIGGLNPAGISILVGAAGGAKQAGIKPLGKHVTTQRIVDRHREALEIVWREAESIPVVELPAGAEVLAWDRWTRTPVVAILAARRILWIATDPGPKGYEKFPYLPQALEKLGFEPPYRANHLWAFFDSGYRARADFRYLAAKWRTAGIAALHIAAWHYFDGDPAKDRELESLIDACHRNRIQVYAWLELPHVSEKFWADHPEWREKTALLEDAHLDWRKLMNLTHPDCAASVRKGAASLLTRFDWDGVNLAELYFESLEGAANPARFTPFNSNVRKEYQERAGVDPLELLRPKANGLPGFLTYRAELAARLQKEWLAYLQQVKPGLDIVWTHIDDRYDPRMRDLLGADTARALPLAKEFDATFLIEDPATVWHLGPRRYLDIAGKYASSAPSTPLAIDLNIVERYQDVYPTKQQTGAELFQLVHHAAQAFTRVALYFENSILPPDYPLLAAAAAPKSPGRARGIAWQGPVAVNGKPWPVTDGRTAWIPPGDQQIASAPEFPPVRLLDLNAELLSAEATANGFVFHYESKGRTYARFSAEGLQMQIDGRPSEVRSDVVTLPRGRHEVTVTRSQPAGRN